MTPDQLKAARLLGAGWKREDVAREVGKSMKTIDRWAKVEGFEQEMQRARQGRDTSILEDALTATFKDGRADHATRLRAYTALYGRKPPKGDGSTPDGDEEEVEREVTYADDLTDAERGVVGEAFEDKEVCLVIDCSAWETFEAGGTTRTLASREALPTGASIVYLNVPAAATTSWVRA